MYRWSWTVGLDYSGPAAEADVQFGSQWVRDDLPAGQHTFYIPLEGSGAAVLVALAAPAPGGCLTGLSVGTWQPAPSGPAFPRTPVPG